MCFHHDVLPKVGGPSNHELKPLKPGAKLELIRVVLSVLATLSVLSGESKHDPSSQSLTCRFTKAQWVTGCFPEAETEDTLAVPSLPSQVASPGNGLPFHELLPRPGFPNLACEASEVQLMAATGGAELSCYRCIIPFAVVVFITGIVVTAVAYSFNSHGSIISIFGLVLLSSGLLLLASSALCWKLRQRNKKVKRRESQTALVVNQRSLFA
ncbi:hypothetical protein STEG23_035848 [Scotinomys teguina]